MIRDRIRTLMEQKKWSQSDLARELGEHRNWVIKRLSGETDVKADDLVRFAAALDVSPCAFFEEVKPAPTVVELSDRSIDRIGEVVAERIQRVLEEAPEPGQPAPPRTAERARQIARRKTAELARRWEELTEDEQAAFWQWLEEQQHQSIERSNAIG